MKPTFHTADLRRFLKRPLLKDEITIAEALERQRHSSGQVRAVINDPNGSLEQILLDYIRYIQHLNPRECILISPSRGQGSRNTPFRGPGGLTPRSYLRIYGTTRPIGQILLLNAHTYRHLDQILHITLPYANGPFSVVIVHGNAEHATKHANHFAKYYQFWQQSNDKFFQTISREGGIPASERSQANSSWSGGIPASERSQVLLILNPSYLILKKSPAPLLYHQLAPTKIPA